MAIWRGLKSFGARDFSPENSSDEGLKSLAPTKNSCPTNSHLSTSAIPIDEQYKSCWNPAALFFLLHNLSVRGIPIDKQNKSC